MMPATSTKQNGIHYTPPELADFLAERILRHAALPARQITILDPACGDGRLLTAIVGRMSRDDRGRLRLIGYETDADAIERAVAETRRLGVDAADWHHADFLDVPGVAETDVADSGAGSNPDLQALPRADIVISNPPYVRTQVLGADRAQQLARRFGLTGRVDLYQPFTIGMSRVLKPGGTLGLLTSNRLLTTRSGATIRRLLRQEFSLQAICDLGDTRLFAAAVLPVIVIGKKHDGPAERQASCAFDRVYECRDGSRTTAVTQRFPSIIDAVRAVDVEGIVETGGTSFRIQRGALNEVAGDAVWTQVTSRSQAWLEQVRQRQFATFADLARVRVGVKTTADEVFIRDWEQLPPHVRPESELLYPLITHHDACQWNRSGDRPYQKRLLYPHTVAAGRRVAVDLARYPRAADYLEQHKDRLSRRQYLLNAGRRWYEIWVPQQPADWRRPKIVYPDISETPRFWLDHSGAIVNGDCYWMTLRDGVADDWLSMLLAVANSTFILQYYDIVFHNKLYAGRRRFMTQYVKQFPVPPLGSTVAKRIVAKVRRGLSQGMTDQVADEIDELVWRSFGVRRGEEGGGEEGGDV